MPRLSRGETSLVIDVLRDAANRGSGRACRLLQRLEQALARSVDAVREERRHTRAARAPVSRSRERRGGPS